MAVGRVYDGAVAAAVAADASVGTENFVIPVVGECDDGWLLEPPPPGRERSAGSSIVAVATDAPLDTHELTRLARRAGLGLARTGSVAHHGSGEIFVALSTGKGPALSSYERTGFFTAVVDATEESVLNSLWAAEDVEGREGRVIRALPREPVLELLRKHGRIGTGTAGACP